MRFARLSVSWPESCRCLGRSVMIWQTSTSPATRPQAVCINAEETCDYAHHGEALSMQYDPGSSRCCGKGVFERVVGTRSAVQVQSKKS